MDLQPRFGLAGKSRCHAAGLRTGVIVFAITSCREIQRILTIRNLIGLHIGDIMKTRFSIGMMKPFRKEPWRAGMFRRRAGPKYSLFALDAFIAHACVIGNASAAGAAEFLKNVFFRAVPEILPFAQALRERTKNVDVAQRSRWWIKSFLPADHAPFKVRHRSFFFRPLGDREKVVGMTRRFVHE